MELDVNGKTVSIDVDPQRNLLSVLRDELHLTGSKYGCSEGQCGACTVLVDGQPTQSCIATMEDLAGKRVTTIEGLAQDGRLHPLQEAFLEREALQCGYCTPGMIMSAAALLEANPKPTVPEIVDFMRDNICRCGVYPRIIAAIRRAAEMPVDKTADVDGDHLVAPAGADPELVDYWDTDPLPPFEVSAEGITVAIFDEDVAQAQEESGRSVQPFDENNPSLVGPWLHINEDGAITVHVGKVEVGQNIRTSLSQIVAEELRVPISSVRMVMADTVLSPYDRGTFGSRTTPITSLQLRKLAAATRELLLDLAAEQWAAPSGLPSAIGAPARSSLVLAEGRISYPDAAQSSSYGDLAKNHHLFKTITDDEPAPPAEQWTTAGRSTAKINGQSFVTGKHRYASDMQMPGMLYGKVLRPPAFHAVMGSVDTSAAEAIPGVTVVQDDDFVGVTAPDELTATRAIDAIRARWRTTLQLSQPELFGYLKENPADPAEIDSRAQFEHRAGSVEEALSAADRTLQQTYTVDYIAHTPLEPRAALAKWEDGRLTVWTGTQRPFGVRSELVQAFQMSEDRVRVIVPDTGSGYGGKHTGDAAIEAARLAKATGKPVKRIWTREEEFTWAYFRPAGLIEVSSGVRSDGALTAWEFHNYNSGSAGIQTLYEIPNQHIEFHPTDSPPLRQGAYRSLSATANHFPRESHMDALARSLEIDPLDFRLQNLQDSRLKAVLTAAAEAFGWGAAIPASKRGYGIAGGYDKGSYVATCAEVEVDCENGKIQVIRVVQAFECGAIINPDHLRNQAEGAIVHGLGGALFESIEFANGKILDPRFPDYQVPRFEDAPSIEIVLLDRKDLPPVGAGETPIVGIAPAIGNAIFSATGIRLCSLPMAPRFLEACA